MSGYLVNFPTAIQSIWWGIQLWGLAESHPIHLPSLHGGEVFCLPAFVPPIDMVNSESVVSVKPGDSGVVTGFQVHAFTHTWSAENFVAYNIFTLDSWTRCYH